jgi:Ca2+-binding EF-hand superfamily protein
VKVKAPEVKVKAPEVKVKAPEVKVKAPEVKVKAPEASIEVKVKTPEMKVKAPAASIEVKVKAPEVKVKAPEVSIEVKVKAPEVRAPTAEIEVEVKVPTMGGGKSAFQAPEVPVVDMDSIRSELEAELRSKMETELSGRIEAAVSVATAEIVASAEARIALAVGEAVHAANEDCNVRCAREVAAALAGHKAPTCTAIPVEAVFDAHVDLTMKRARAKFNQLDKNKNGLLEGDELMALGCWVYSSFHPGSNVNEETKKAEGAKILSRLDVNEDGAMSFEEFDGWFRKTHASIEKFRRGLVEKRPPIPIPAAAVFDAHVEKLIRRAHKKFDQLDKNGNGLLEGEELTALGNWVYESFHPGQKLCDADQEAEGAKILGRLDENEDGAMSFDEFEGWFRRTCASIEKYRRGLSQRTRSEPKAKAECPAAASDDHVQSVAERIASGQRAGDTPVSPYYSTNRYAYSTHGFNQAPMYAYGPGSYAHMVPPPISPRPDLGAPPMVPQSFVPPMGIRSVVGMTSVHGHFTHSPATQEMLAQGLVSPAERIHAVYRSEK